MDQADLSAAMHVRMADNEAIDVLSEGGFAVMNALMDNPSTTRQLAVRLGLNRARIQFIIDRFLECGDVYLYRETNEGGRREQYYALTDTKTVFMVRDRNASQSRMAVVELISQTLRTNVAQLDEQQAQATVMTLKMTHCKLRPARAAEFLRRLEELAQAFSDAEEEDSEESFGMALALYPVAK